VIGSDHDVFGVGERVRGAALPTGREGPGVEDFGGKEELLGQLLRPLLSECRRDDDQNLPVSFRPELADDQRCFSASRESGDRKANMAASI